MSDPDGHMVESSNGQALGKPDARLDPEKAARREVSNSFDSEVFR